MGRSAGLVGRQRELTVLERACRGRESRLVLVSGDAGIGKSRLVEQVARRAPEWDVLPVRCGCLPLTEKLPLLPAVEALRHLHRHDGGRLLAAALDRSPPYVRTELARLLPTLAPDFMPALGRGEAGERDRLFAAAGELLLQVCDGGPRVLLVVEDAHWADSATLDLLTYLHAISPDGGPLLVVTCRGDERPQPAHVTGWLAHLRRLPSVTEVRLAPLSREEVEQQVTGLLDAPAPPRLVDELYARGQGNPFFTEQLLAAAEGISGASGAVPLPDRLAELLTSRLAGVSPPARAVLAALGVAGRPLTEPQLTAVTELDEVATRRALRELTETALLALPTPDGAHQPRHALLAEAVRSGLLPGERQTLHARLATTLETSADAALAAETAVHWAAAGRPDQELRATVTAAHAAAQVLAYTTAADHWHRAITLAEQHPDTATALGLQPPQLYLHAIDSLEAAGRLAEGSLLAGAAFQRYADWPDEQVAGLVHVRWGLYLADDQPTAARPVLEKAVRLLAGGSPSAEHAEALLRYAQACRLTGSHEESRRAVVRAREVAQGAQAPGLEVRALASLSLDHLERGEVERGLAALTEGRVLLGPVDDVQARIWLATFTSDALLKVGRLGDAERVALEAFEAARQAGRGGSSDVGVLLANAAEAALERGDTSAAARLVRPVSDATPSRDSGHVHLARAAVDLRQGELDQACRRLLAVRDVIFTNIESSREVQRIAIDLHLWAGEPDRALRAAEDIVAELMAAGRALFAGELLALAARAAADLAERARARGDAGGERVALAAGDRLADAVTRMQNVPLTDHPYLARVPGDRADWTAERQRSLGRPDPQPWALAATAWQQLGRPHRTAYAQWRQAETLLSSGDRTAAGSVLQSAARAAAGHEPLLRGISRLATRARLNPAGPDGTEPPTAPRQPAPFGLTDREQSVLRLLARGRTNTQIGAELYMSPKTASVHVTHILRKLDVANRVEAAAVAERAGLLTEE